MINLAVKNIRFQCHIGCFWYPISFIYFICSFNTCHRKFLWLTFYIYRDVSGIKNRIDAERHRSVKETWNTNMGNEFCINSFCDMNAFKKIFRSFETISDCIIEYECLEMFLCVFSTYVFIDCYIFLYTVMFIFYI